ncbi:hypothetical protein GTQ48_08050 [Alteromonas genovensis]|uniref:TniQ domain-containing protein n=1 Tax=Alteromonas genovensis TaxID=471225 RepID=A0A6N9TE84_9ALTE|nr:TniQ family protein [Alteromonas genovensis]NDW15470.1 hypothetical protein [Alteromonas genovensis]
MRNHFPVRPRPKADESIDGFLIRLAKKNGFFSIKDIFKVLGLKYYPSSLDVTHERFYEFIEQLAPTLRCSSEELFNPLMKNTEYLRDASRIVIDITSKSPKICMGCLSEQEPYIKASWQMVHFTHCEQHLTTLIDTCRGCGNKLRWDADLLNGCSSCGYRWELPNTALVQKIPMYQAIHSTLEHDALKVYLIALFAAVEYIANPCVFIPFQAKYFKMDTVEVSSILFQAYGLIQNSFYLTQFHRSVVSYLDKSYCFTDKSSLQKLPHNLRALPKLPISLARDDHFQFKLLDGSNCYTSALSLTQAASLLGISGTELTEITKHLSLSVGKVSRIAVYQLKDLDAFANSLMARAVFVEGKQDTIPITSLSSLSHKFLFNYGEALELIWNNNVSLYREKESALFKDIRVDKYELMKLLKESEERQFERLLSPSELAIYFNVNILKLRTMAELLRWEKVQVNRTSYQFSPNAIKAFIKDFVVLEKWCDFQLYGKVPLNKYLLSEGFKPLANPYEEKCKLFIYRKSDALLDAIAQFETHWHKAQPPRILKQQFQIQKPTVLSDSASQQFQGRCTV